jgi:hypothetical protein
MNSFLIDTNVLSEYNRPGGPDVGVKYWLEATDRQSQYVSVITLAEIQKGIELLAEGSDGRNLNSGSRKTWKYGSPAAFFRWIVGWPCDGHRLWPKDHEQGGRCP